MGIALDRNRERRNAGGFLKANAELVGTSLRFLDLTLIVLGASIAHFLRFDSFSLSQINVLALFVALFGAATILPLLDLYKPWRGMSVWLEIRTLLMGWLAIAILIPLIGYLSKTGEDYSRLWFGYWVLSTLILMVVSRVLIRSASKWARNAGLNTRNVVIVGAGSLGRRVAKNLAENEWVGTRVVAFLDADPSLHGRLVDGIPVLGSPSKLSDLVDGSRTMTDKTDTHQVHYAEVDQVWVALPLTDEDQITETFELMENSAIGVVFVPDIFLRSLLNYSVDDFAGMPVVNLRVSPIVGIPSTLKMVEDIVVSVAAICFTAPLMILISVLIKLESNGPVLFKQHRYGIDGKKIVVWKFRTMSVMEEGDAVVQAKRNDSRVTRVGRILRTTSLDELPQFFNVLQGKMSVVGPRPHAVVHNEHYRKIVDRYMWRCAVKPGITGWAQVNGWRGETDTNEKMENRVMFDLEYLERWSIWLDVKIIFRTIWQGFKTGNVY